jgi:hypothetical protein
LDCSGFLDCKGFLACSGFLDCKGFLTKCLSLVLSDLFRVFVPRALHGRYDCFLLLSLVLFRLFRVFIFLIFSGMSLGLKFLNLCILAASQI